MSFRLQRERLVECKLRKLGIRDEAVLQAMLEVPREQFVPEKLREFAYFNLPLRFRWWRDEQVCDRNRQRNSVRSHLVMSSLVTD